MKTKKSLIFIIIFLFSILSTKAKEIDFISSNIDISENGNIIKALDVTVKIPSKKLEIKSDKANYNKKNKVIIFEQNVIIKDINNNLILEGDLIKYNEVKDLIESEKKSNLNLNKKYVIESDKLSFDRKTGKIFGNDGAIIIDNEENIYKLNEKFEFNIFSEIIKSNNSLIIDNQNNKYYFEDLIINLSKNEIIGKELKIEFEKGYFGNKNNDPVLKGRGAYDNDNELKVYKAVFSTCNIENKKCRGWELNTEEFNHDKKKKIFEYKNSWLKIFNKKIFYFPYFNHPDPTITRKSGFLTPSYSSSDNLGTSVNIPYFKVLSRDKDITFNPKYYADKSFLLQNEYRQALQKSRILSDFSFLIGDTGTKGHFFYNQKGNYKKNIKYEINLQDVKGDNYLKNYKLSKSSSIIKDDNLLLSNLDIDWGLRDAKFVTSFKIFEELSRNYHDRYQYVFPDFNFSKNILVPDNYNGKFQFNSYGYNKNYDTNITESVLTNDFIFSSNQYIQENGLVSNYNLLLKNSNSYADNSSNFEENANYNLFGTFKFDTRYPLQKTLQNYIHYLTPVASIMYSPNGNSDIATKDILLNYNNVFSINRIGTDHQVEGGESLSLGLEFKRKDINEKDILDFKIANVLKPNENYKLPVKSKLNKTRSDIFGNLNYNINENLKLGYFFSHDRDLKYSNLEQYNLDYKVNNFITSFSYYSEDHEVGNKENAKNKSSLNFDRDNKFIFEISKNLNDDFTQYYDLIYVYETDCISFNLNYNKSFYSDGNIEPNKSLSFLIKIIPFTELGVSNMGSFVKN